MLTDFEIMFVKLFAKVFSKSLDEAQATQCEQMSDFLSLIMIKSRLLNFIILVEFFRSGERERERERERGGDNILIKMHTNKPRERVANGAQAG